MHTHLLRAVAMALILFASACGSDNPIETTAVTMAPMTMAPIAGTAADHSHELTDWPADMAVPVLALTATPHDDGSADFEVDIEGFTLQQGDGTNAKPGAGHLHIMVDGRDAGMGFTPDVHVEGLEPGPHQLEIQLSAVTHGTYAVDGVPLSYIADFVIPGDVAPPDTVIEITVDESGVVGGIVEASVSIGDVVEIQIESAVAEELHLHVYDVSAELKAGETTTVRFVADIPGVFEAELEGLSVQVLNLAVR